MSGTGPVMPKMRTVQGRDTKRMGAGDQRHLRKHSILAAAGTGSAADFATRFRTNAKVPVCTRTMKVTKSHFTWH